MGPLSLNTCMTSWAREQPSHLINTICGDAVMTEVPVPQYCCNQLAQGAPMMQCNLAARPKFVKVGCSR